ncbi:MAG: DinB family protein [Candidatus Eisenbacteria bacterium]
MNKAVLTPSWDYFRTVNGVGLRAIALLPTDQLDTHPIPGMRTPKEVVVHMYQNIEGITAGVASGEIRDFEAEEKATADKIKSTDALVAWCRAQWDAGHTTFQGLTDAQVQADVKTPWGFAFPGFIMLQILSDEYWHHRGQLYCYLRALGIAPPSIYDFAHNEPAFQPAQKSGA